MAAPSASSILLSNITSNMSAGRDYSAYTSSYGGSSSSSGIGRYSSLGASSGYSSGYSTTYSTSYGTGSSSRYSSYSSPSYTSSYLDDYGSGGSSTLSGYRSSSSYRPISSRYNSTTETDPIRSYSTSSYISPVPTYDQFGRELSNYDKWKLSSGRNDAFASSSSSSSSQLSSSRLLKEGCEAEDSKGSSSSYSSSASGGLPRRVRFARITSRDAADDEDVTDHVRKHREATVAPSSLRPREDDFRSSKPTARAFSVAPSSFKTSSSSSSSFEDEPTKGSGSSSALRGSSVAPASRRISASSFNATKGCSLAGLPFGVQSKLSGYSLHDVRGDGGCYYRCLSLYFTGSEENYMKYRREVLAYIKDNLDNYSSMIRSETKSTSDYFTRKTRADLQDWAETTEIIATCCVYNINVHVLALVPGRGRSWEWLHFDPSIGTGRPSHATRDIYLYNQGSVHFMLCTPN